MPKKRFNIWMDVALIAKIKAEARLIGVNGVSTYCRIACLEKLKRDQRARAAEEQPR